MLGKHLQLEWVFIFIPIYTDCHVSYIYIISMYIQYICAYTYIVLCKFVPSSLKPPEGPATGISTCFFGWARWREDGVDTVAKPWLASRLERRESFSRWARMVPSLPKGPPDQQANLPDWLTNQRPQLQRSFEVEDISSRLRWMLHRRNRNQRCNIPVWVPKSTSASFIKRHWFVMYPVV